MEFSARKLLAWVWSFWIIFSLWLFIPQLNKPVIGWETLTWDMAYELAFKGPAAAHFYFDFPFYAYLVGACFKIFGVTEASARVTGILSFMSMPPLLYLLLRELVRKESLACAFFISSLLYLVSIPVLQGALVVDKADTHLCTALITFCYALFLKAARRNSRRVMIAAGGVYAAALSAKFVPALACCAALPLGYAFQGQARKGISAVLRILVPGMILFLVIWYAYCRFFGIAGQFMEPFRFYAAAAFESGGLSGAYLLTKTGLDMFRVILWFSPLFVFLAAASVGALYRDCRGTVRLVRSETSNGEDPQTEKNQAPHPAAYCAVLLIGYLYSNATFAGFPKYCVPALPFLCCLTGIYIGKIWERVMPRGKTLVVSLVLLLGGIVYYYSAVGDWLYPLYELRLAQAAGCMHDAWWGFIRQAALYCLYPACACLAVYGFLRHTRITSVVMSFFIAYVAANISLSFIQRNADYSVNYAYGVRGAQSILSFVRSNRGMDPRGQGRGTSRRMEVWSSIEGFVANAGPGIFRAIPLNAWRDERAFTDFLALKKPPILLVGLGANTAGQMRMLNEAAVRRVLEDYYSPLDFGSYRMWVRQL